MGYSNEHNRIFITDNGANIVAAFNRYYAVLTDDDDNNSYSNSEFDNEQNEELGQCKILVILDEAKTIAHGCVFA